MSEMQNYMGYQWILIDGDVITVGINEEGLEEFSEINNIDLPNDNDEVFPDEVCGEVDTDQGPLNIYSPIKGIVVEVNLAVSEKPNLIQDDCQGDGWLFRIEADNIDDLNEDQDIEE